MQAYARAVDAKNPHDAVARELELLDRHARDAADAGAQGREVWRRRATCWWSRASAG